ncbi:hypothetical protein BN946_scf184912.g6 [Trametes cinnabarina]|uniref:Fungal-type protein kinase domain-containing protein n=1 Tax=Pycnoporus cinnabarinus TaxID=5643 RepID=A0A060SSI8_PYCCI|nr:hypothetical protein BN946_scf184912.g6 [Trametes cinnabarina]
MSNNSSSAGLDRSPNPGTPPGYRTPPPRTPSPRADVSRGVAHQPEGNSSEAGDDQSLPVPKPPTTHYDASPVGRKSLHDSLAGAFASERTPNVDKKRRDIRLSMTGKTILISLEEFMNRFIPAPPGETEPVEAFKAVDFTGIPQDIESDMYGPLVAAFNQEWLLPHDIPVSAPHKGDGTVASNQKIDGGLYLRGNAPQDSTSWSSIELSIECKIDATKQDPFDDKTKNPEASAITRKDVRGQIMCYAVLVFDNQHRVHHFTLLILGAMARLVRWDRSGVLVTHKFDYTKEPEKLAQFLWRFGRMTPAQRGHDTTAVRVLPGSADFRLMHARATTPLMNRNGRVIDEHARVMFEQSLKVTVRVCIEDDSGKKTYDVVEKDAPLWRLTVHGEQGPRHFLVGKPHTTAASLAGRGTRTYVAIDTADPDGQFVYMKDAWRVAHDGIDQEGKILKKLNDDSDGGPVVGVPTLRCHGDVVGQVTLSQDVWREKHPTAKHDDCPLKTHRHYRLVVNEVCLPMSKFICFMELVGLFIDCIEAHGHAYTRKGLLHRDISAGNVLIYPKVVDVGGQVSEERVGLLADWELAKQVRKAEDEDAPRQPDRTGTWQFTSAMALDNPKKRIMVQDDMESFFHLLLYFAIRYLPHNCDNVGDFMDRYFDGYHEMNGVYYGGKEKLASMNTGTLTTSRFLPLRFYIPKESDRPNPDDRASSSPDHSASQARAVDSGRPVDSARSSSCVGPKVAQPSITAGGTNGLLKLHPINAIFTGFLTRIKAHYTLYYTSRTTVEEAPAQSITPVTTPEAPPASSIDMNTLVRLKHAAKARETSAATPESALADKQKKDLAELAAKLGDHDDIVSFLAHHIGSQFPWPAYVDRISDQLPKNYRRGNETALGSKRTLESTQIGTDEPPSKRSRSVR